MEHFRLSSVIDYYMLLTLQFEATDAAAEIPTHSQAHFIEKIGVMVADYEEGLSTAIFNYLVMACAGEARHGTRCATGMIPDLDTVYGRDGACRKITQYEPIEALERFMELFNDYDWAGGYGGYAWGHMAEFAYKYGKGQISRQFFIDHIVDLEHNGGFAFNKSEALDQAGLRYDIDQDMLVKFLDLKTFSPSLMRIDLPSWVYRYISKGVARMINKFYMIFRPGQTPDYHLQDCDKGFPVVKVIEWGDWLLDDICEVERYHCYECGCGLDSDDYCDSDGDVWCEDCWYQNHTQCDNCGEWYHNNYDMFNVDGNTWCRYCTHNYASHCDHCDDWTRDGLIEVEGEMWCEHCASRYANECDKCGEYTTDDLVDIDGNNLCPSCIEYHTASCALCGAVFMKDDMTLDEVSGKYICTEQVCQDEYLADPNAVYLAQPALPAPGQLPLPF